MAANPLPLKMLTVRPICIPAYRDERIFVGYGQWYLDNHKLLEDYYNSLSLYTEGEPLGDYYRFCREQYRREMANILLQAGTEYTQDEPLDPRRGEEPICDNE